MPTELLLGALVGAVQGGGVTGFLSKRQVRASSNMEYGVAYSAGMLWGRPYLDCFYVHVRPPCTSLLQDHLRRLTMVRVQASITSSLQCWFLPLAEP